MPAPEADRADGSLGCVAQPIKVAWPFGRGMWRSSNIVARPGITDTPSLELGPSAPNLAQEWKPVTGGMSQLEYRPPPIQPTSPGTQKPALRGERAFVADGRSVSRPAPSTEPILPAGPRLWQGGRGGAFRG